MGFTYLNKSLEDEIEKIRKEWNEVGFSIGKIKREIEHLESDIEYDKSISVNRNILKPKKEKLKLLKQRLFTENNLYCNLEKRLNNKQQLLKNKRRKSFKTYVSNLDIDQCYITQLSSNVSTVAVLDNYKSSKKDFLILKNQFYMPFSRKHVSLIITPHYMTLDVDRTQPIMTEFKNDMGKYVDCLTNMRLQPLGKKLVELDKNQNLEDGKIYSFDLPFLIGGQTSNNRSGYGWKWLGPNNYIEGTFYGEVTNFIVAGFVVNSLYFNIQKKSKNKKQEVKTINKNPKQVSKLKKFPSFLMKNIVMLCLERHLNPITILNTAIQIIERGEQERIVFDVHIQKTFETYLSQYQNEYDYLTKLLYEISIQLNCSIVRIIKTDDNFRKKIAKNFFNDERFYEIGSCYYLIPEGEVIDTLLRDINNSWWFNDRYKLPLRIECVNESNLSKDKEVIFEDSRYILYFDSFIYQIHESKKFDMCCSFPIYFQKEYIQYNEEGYICSKCHEPYSYKYDVKEQPGNWVCPNCLTKNSCYNEYIFLEKYFPKNEDIK